MQYLTTYTAPPPRGEFRPATMGDLVEIAKEIANASRSALQTEWSAAAWRTDDENVGRAIGAINSGQTVLVAQDEDGYYFATPDASDDITVKMAEETINWRWLTPHVIEDCGEIVDRAVRQEFAGQPEVIQAWEHACLDGRGPDGPVGADGWVWVRLEDL